MTAAEMVALGPKGFLPVVTRADRERAWGIHETEGHMGFHDAHVREYLAQDDDGVREMLWQGACWPLIQAEEAAAERAAALAEAESFRAYCREMGLNS